MRKPAITNRARQFTRRGRADNDGVLYDYGLAPGVVGAAFGMNGYLTRLLGKRIVFEVRRNG
jgi:hypothetical protein